jgi:hypothetical protein
MNADKKTQLAINGYSKELEELKQKLIKAGYVEPIPSLLSNNMLIVTKQSTLLFECTELKYREPIETLYGAMIYADDPRLEKALRTGQKDIAGYIIGIENYILKRLLRFMRALLKLNKQGSPPINELSRISY